LGKSIGTLKKKNYPCTKFKKITMKKVLSLFAVATFVFAMSSCKKSGTCTCDLGILGSTSVDYEDLNGDEYDAAKTACDASSFCEWSDN
jgi:hypothetical protein